MYKAQSGNPAAGIDAQVLTLSHGSASAIVICL